MKMYNADTVFVREYRNEAAFLQIMSIPRSRSRVSLPNSSSSNTSSLSKRLPRPSLPSENRNNPKFNSNSNPTPNTHIQTPSKPVVTSPPVNSKKRVRDSETFENEVESEPKNERQIETEKTPKRANTPK